MSSSNFVSWSSTRSFSFAKPARGRPMGKYDRMYSALRLQLLGVPDVFWQLPKRRPNNSPRVDRAAKSAICWAVHRVGSGSSACTRAPRVAFTAYWDSNASSSVCVISTVACWLICSVAESSFFKFASCAAGSCTMLTGRAHCRSVLVRTLGSTNT